MEFRGIDDWDHLFHECRQSAFHMEVRDTYAVASESEPLRRFLAGEPPPDYDKSDWTGLIREMTGRGVVVNRVRVITVPHSDYQRWLLSVTDENVEAGEDIRYLPRHLVDAADVPRDDWWLFDGTRVAFNLVDQAGRPAGVAVTTDPKIAAYCGDVKDRLMSMATPYREYINDSPVNCR
ncbi:hypothetical protein LTV02_29715 [Nocardia yamanashiensis]|uniref:DUF6879 family protein n=1 Tax=Nocardia yamanashiensis TaxID=209247 RepID=UPI001E5A1AEC|nr:DUF6879 family protein [Nocardia yamanashiensis]UGT40179.1 hypothetical protein LTV02_29715 [Nocardia yamanashiensis]